VGKLKIADALVLNCNIIFHKTCSLPIRNILYGNVSYCKYKNEYLEALVALVTEILYVKIITNNSTQDRRKCETA
jgi:hypothetical protein